MNHLKCLTYTHRFLHGFKDPQFDSYGFVDSCSDGGDHPLQQLPLVLQEGSKVASSGNHLATKVIPTKQAKVQLICPPVDIPGSGQ